MATIQEAGVRLEEIEERVPLGCAPPPWSPQLPVKFAATDCRREQAPEVKRCKALELLATLRQADPPDLQIWSDGAAVDGCTKGGGGYVIRTRAPGRDTTGCVPAGKLTSSTTAEAAAAAAGLEAALGELEGRSGLVVWLVFDSKALFDRLQSPECCAADHHTAQAALLLGQIARRHRVTVIWVPGHAGLALNEAADRLAKEGCRLPQEAAPVPVSALRAAIRRCGAARARQDYLEAVPVVHPHRRCGGLPLPHVPGRPRYLEVALYQLRANRAPFLRHTQARWRRVDSPGCPHCPAAVEDTVHFLAECPRWAEERRKYIPEISDSMTPLQETPDRVCAFLLATGVLARPLYA